MKKILSILALATVIATSASCGNGSGSKKEVEMAKPFEHKLFTITLAKDWKSSEKDGAVMILKGEKEGMIIMAADKNTDTPETICKNVAEAIKQQNQNAKLSEATDVKIGQYSFKKIVGTDTDPSTKKEVSMYVLITTKGTIGMIIQLSNLEGEDEQAMLATLKIK
ncbi:MAG: hypothetical protein HGA95_05460 [Caldiserica bacterium]|nr:hypothetical protein [Caldisericota bacterium]